MMHVGDIMMHVGDTMSTSEDVQYIGGMPSVHQGDIMSTSGDIMSTSGFSIEIERFLSTCSPRCTEHPPMYWPDVLNTHYTG